MAARVEQWLNGVWYEGRPGAALLAPAAALFGAVAALRRGAYRRGLLRVCRPSLPVVVVGNLSVGGTGKTPLTAWLVQQLAARGIRAGVLMRGYGAATGGPRVVAPHDDPAQVGDEAAMLAAVTRVPVVVSPDRCAGARLLEARGVQLIVCDDGLQHYALARDLEIAVVDAGRGLGNGRLLPAGPLRESVSRLGQVDAIVTNHGAEGPAAGAGSHSGFGGSAAALQLQMRLVSGEARALADPARRRALGDFAAAPVHAVAAIGNPGRFFATLRRAGLQLIEHPFPDHHPFTAGDLRFGDGQPILMTAKDAVKCRAFADERMWEVPVVAELAPDGGHALLASIHRLIPTSLG